MPVAEPHRVDMDEPPRPGQQLGLVLDDDLGACPASHGNRQALVSADAVMLTGTLVLIAQWIRS